MNELCEICKEHIDDCKCKPCPNCGKINIYHCCISGSIYHRRLELNISQETLAQHIGFQHRSNVSRLEAGTLEWKWKDVIAACELLKLEIEIAEKG